MTIGLLVPDRSHAGVIQAAELAIANANHTITGRAVFKLAVRTTEGPWGAGSKESVGLVYEDESRVMIGSLDGRNGHLAEQVATKSPLTYMETFATEPTLSQAFVPFCCCERSESRSAGKIRTETTCWSRKIPR